MNTYMICIQLPKELTDEFFVLIPKQKARIDVLMDEGKILQYALAIDRLTLWVTIIANSKTKALEIISTFPLIKYMKPEIFELAYYNSVATYLPKLIMN